MENLVECERCHGNACLHTIQEDNVNTWLCFGCGFSSNTLYVPGSEEFNKLIEPLPDLYKDLLFITDDKVWVPSSISLPGKGMVFVDGTSKDNWKWAGGLFEEISEEEAHKFPEDQKFKLDFSSLRYFNEKDFMDALEYIGFFNIEV